MVESSNQQLDEQTRISNIASENVIRILLLRFFFVFSIIV